MKTITIAFAMAMALTSFGCKKKSEGSGEAMAKMTEFKDRMCKCADAECAKKVSDDMTAWSQSQPKDTSAAKMSEADTKKATAIGEELSTCMQKAMTPAAGAAPTGADPAAAPTGAAPAGDPAAAPAADPAAAPTGAAAPAGAAPSDPNAAAAPAGGTAPAAPAGEMKAEEKK